MGLEMRRRRNIEKSDLDSLYEIKWDKKDSTKQDSTKQDRTSKDLEDLKSVKDLLNSMEEPILSEQEAGKATIYTEFEKKRLEDLKSIKDLLNSMEEPIFSEQEAGKATIYTEFEKKRDERSFEEISSEEMLKRINAMFQDRS
jgi:hypothetical protein